MSAFYSIKEPIRYEGPNARSELAFRWYNPEQVVMGKTMREHMRFAVAYWHTLCWPGTDPFGGDTFNTAVYLARAGVEVAYATALGDTDWNLQARVTWEFQPNWSLVGGVDVFGGGSGGYFGRFEDQDRVYGEVWYRF